MKKSLLIFGMLLAGSTFITSCTKDLKDDVKDLQGRVNEVENLIGSNEPITATTTFTDNDNATRTVSDVYKFKASGLSTQYMIKNDDGTYDVYIERFSDVDWNESAAIEFTYNPTTKAITGEQVYHDWDDLDAYGNFSFFNEGYEGNTINITIDKFDVNTGEVSVKVTASATGDYTSQYYGPNPGKPVNTTLAFTGKLKVYEREG